MVDDTSWTVAHLGPRSPETHIAQFYDSEQFVCEMAAEFLLAGSRKGQTLVLVATPAHREAITSILVKNGVDPASVVSIDAQEMMSAFMSGDMPDERRFRTSMSGVITKAAGSGGTPISIYGEMADLLMSSGKWEASLRLEEFWNDLAAVHQFSILCAHSLENFYDDSAGALLHEVCRRHGGVNPAA